MSWQPSERYPDPAIELLDSEFSRYRLSNTRIERLFDGARYGEGPVWFGDARCLLWSDIPQNQILRWDEQTEQVSVFRPLSNKSNGLARDNYGRLICCEHLSRSLTRTEYDGRITTLASEYQGHRLNSPNDVTVAVNGDIWFSDPTFGLQDNYEGLLGQSELPGAVYRYREGEPLMQMVQLEQPNGLVFSADERYLYVVSSGRRPQQIIRYRIGEQGLTEPQLVVSAELGEIIDGLCLDADGNLWCGWGGSASCDGVRVFNAEGDVLGHIHLPCRCANLCFGGAKGNRLFMAAGPSLFSLYVNSCGANWTR